MEGSQWMEVKNTPLLFQQELNTYYKDILNCEIVHPPYWDWKVPETFFLRKRKWIQPYHDWLGDEVLDYIKFDGKEYAIVKTDSLSVTPHIEVKKWLETVDYTTIATIVDSKRVVEATWWTFDEFWTLWTVNCISTQFNSNWNKLYIFSRSQYTINWDTNYQLFVSVYDLPVPYNINPHTIKIWHTYRIAAASSIASEWAIVCKLDSDWKNIYWYSNSEHKFFQIKLWRNWDFTSLSNEIIFSETEVPSELQWITWISISHDWDAIFFANNTIKLWSFKFRFNNIALDNEIASKDFTWHNYLWVALNSEWTKMYATSWWYIYQFEWTSPFNITSFTYANKSKQVDASATWAMDITISNEYIICSQQSLYVREWTWPHAKVLATQNYNANVRHAFKRDFQSCKWNPVFWDWSTTKITWSTDAWVHKLTPTVTTTWTTNQYAGKYVMIFGWATSAWSTTWVWWWQIFQIKSNTATYLTVAGWDTKPNESTYAIFDDFWEALSFIWNDWVYTIHYDWGTSWTPFVKRLEWLNNKDATAVVDATWNNGRIFEVLTNWLIACSATQTSNWENALYWWQYAAFFNWSSTIWNVTWAMRIITFKDIVILFTHDSIYVIKNESINVTVEDSSWYKTSFTADAYPINLAFDFVWLLHKNAICAYNTWIYFVSDKKEFLSLNIEESYYNKYKITTEDLWVDIQQWMDWIEEWDDVSIGIDTKTIYIIWNNSKKSTIFQYDTYYSFWHRWETQLMIKNIRVDTHQTYMGLITYRYWLSDEKLDCYAYDYTQHLRWFNWDTDIFSMKTILYHKLYLWVHTNPDTKLIYKAMLSDWLYKYELPLNQIRFLQKAENLNNNWILGKWVLWFTPLGWKAEDIIIWEYLSEVDVLEAPLGFTYNLLEIIIEWDFETGGNILWTLVHDPHLTPYEDVIPYLNDD